MPENDKRVVHEDHPVFTKGLHRSLIKSRPSNERHLFPHSNAVKKEAVRIASELNLPPEQIAIIKRSALLHDVGKLRPEMRQLFFEVEGRFTAEQQKRASAHAYLSAVMIRRDWENWGDLIPEAWMVCPIVMIVAGHHWRYDQSEYLYSRQLLEEPEFKPWIEANKMDHPEFEAMPHDFPLLGMRILKVADYFRTRIKGRHYAHPVAPELALIELESGSNAEFDPNVVEALKKTWNTRRHKQIRT